VENKNQKPRDTLFQVVESIKIIAKLKLKKRKKKRSNNKSRSQQC
jgi:hypothetical protein